MDNLPFKGQQYLRLRRCLKTVVVHVCQFLLIHQYNINTLFELIHDRGLQIFVAGEHGLSGSAPGRVDIDYEELFVFLVEVVKEMLFITNSCG